MTNAELIKALRYCTDNEKQDGCDECPYLHNGMCHTMLSDAAYALEADEKRISELEKRTKLPDRQEFLSKGSFIEEPLSRPKEGEWIDINGTMFAECSVCGSRHYGCNTPYCDMCGARMR